MGQHFWQNSKWTGHKGREGHVLYQGVKSQKQKAGLNSHRERVKAEEEVRKPGKMTEGSLKDRGRPRWMAHGRRDRKKASGEGRRV